MGSIPTPSTSAQADLSSLTLSSLTLTLNLKLTRNWWIWSKRIGAPLQGDFARIKCQIFGLYFSVSECRCGGFCCTKIAGVRLDEELVLKTGSSVRDWEFESPARCIAARRSLLTHALSHTHTKTISPHSRSFSHSHSYSNLHSTRGFGRMAMALACKARLGGFDSRIPLECLRMEDGSGTSFRYGGFLYHG